MIDNFWRPVRESNPYRRRERDTIECNSMEPRCCCSLQQLGGLKGDRVRSLLLQFLNGFEFSVTPNLKHKLAARDWKHNVSTWPIYGSSYKQRIRNRVDFGGAEGDRTPDLMTARHFPLVSLSFYYALASHFG